MALRRDFSEVTSFDGEPRLQAAVERLRSFVVDREWSKFHDPKNLAMSLASEAGELLAELRWVESSRADEHVNTSQHRPQIENEVADVAIALLLFCDRSGINLFDAIDRKITINESNYPVAVARGVAGRPVARSPRTVNRVIAVDWSGDAGGGAKTIWLAEIADGQLLRLENGRTRAQLIDELIRVSRKHPDTAIGIDFAFSFPEWFVRQLGATNSSELWSLVAEHGEDWLARCEAPFWGRPGVRNPKAGEEFRNTEKGIGRLAGGQAKSLFQIGGAGAVGTGSIRGMPFLLSLQEAGIAIWPFSKLRLPIVLEIYPRLLTGPVKKSDHEARRLYLKTHFPYLSTNFLERGCNSEDAFDALVSAIVMWDSIDELPPSGRDSSSTAVIEGEIWMPNTVGRIQKRAAELPVLDSRSAEEILGYDENGLPT